MAGTTDAELCLHKDIAAGNEDKTKSNVPPTGEFWVTDVSGESSFDLNCYVAIAFDGVIFWHTKGSSKADNAFTFTGDGVKKVELILSAVDLPTGSAILGGRCIVRYKT